MLGTGLDRWNWWDWDPWREMQRLQRQMNRLFEGIEPWSARDYPAVNLWTSDNDVVLTAELPGIEAQDLDVSVQDNLLTLRGTRKAETLQKGETYHRQERAGGTFVRTVQLPFEVEADKVQAHLEKGILQLNLPRAEAAKPRQIQVKTV
jgi:HSP20 family protein